jgi:hypothetical protein
LNKIVITLLLLLLLPLDSAAQKSVSQLLLAHASALQQFLSGHPDLDFLSESGCDRDSLRDMRKHFGARFMPYYRVGDFNRDGRQDFALVLVKDVPPKEDPGLADTHRFQYEVTVVVFNGLRGGGYKAVFVKNTTAPLVCFLAMSREKRPKLYFAIYETDAGFVMTPAGQGYIAEGLSDGD